MPDLAAAANTATLFLAGDVMTGRGIDQILPHANAPVLREPSVQRADQYVELAERANGSIPRPVNSRYIWGNALEELERVRPDLRIVNLETSVTTSDDFWPEKAIHYRMHPAHAPCLTAARIDCCTLANNHVLDFGYAGLEQTLATLRAAGIAYCGAGEDLAAAKRPAWFDLPGGARVAVIACGCMTAGIPAEWSAAPDRAGVFLVDERDRKVAKEVRCLVEPPDSRPTLVVASIHWGGNWGYEVSRRHRRFARRLIKRAGVHLVFGHSSHHVRGFEVYRGRLILYGCGDLLTDYEGIRGHESYRKDLGLMYFPSFDLTTGRLLAMEMVPTRMRRFQITRAEPADVQWLAEMLNREGVPLGTRVEITGDNRLRARW